jgi:hypothetical protein
LALTLAEQSQMNKVQHTIFRVFMSHLPLGMRSNLTLAFSYGARSAFGQNGKSYLRKMLSRRQLQGFVRRAVGKDISSQI